MQQVRKFSKPISGPRVAQGKKYIVRSIHTMSPRSLGVTLVIVLFPLAVNRKSSADAYLSLSPVTSELSNSLIEAYPLVPAVWSSIGCRTFFCLAFRPLVTLISLESYFTILKRLCLDGFAAVFELFAKGG